MVSDDVKHEWTATIGGFEEMSAQERVSQGPTFKASLDAVEPWTDSSWGLFGQSFDTYQALQERLAAARSSAMIEAGRSASGAFVSPQAAPRSVAGAALSGFGEGLEDSAKRLSKIGDSWLDAAKLAPLLIVLVVGLVIFRRGS